MENMRSSTQLCSFALDNTHLESQRLLGKCLVLKTVLLHMHYIIV